MTKKYRLKKNIFPRKFCFVKIAVVLFCVSSLFFQAKPVSAAAWLANWSYRKQITISNANVNSNLSYFPLLIKLTNDPDMGSGVSDTNNGDDVRFTTSDGQTLLPYERESFSVTSSEANGNFWVQVPTIASGATTNIYIYYGNSSQISSDWTTATSTITNCTSVTNAQCVWSENGANNYKSIWHFNQTGTPTDWYDSTSNANNGINNGVTATTGNIAGAGYFNGSSYVTASNSFGALPAVSVSLWVKTDTSGMGFTIGNYRTGGGVFRLISVSGNTGVFQISNGYSDYNASLTFKNDGNWHHIVGTWDGTTIRIYQDGVVSPTTATYSAANISDSAPIWIGLANSGGTDGTGNYNEVRISSVARSDAWIKFEYCNEMASTSANCTVPTGGYASNELTFANQEAAVGLSSSINSVYQYSTGNPVTLAGMDTSWTSGNPGSPTFILSGDTEASITSQTVTSATQATIVINAGNTTGTLTITDPSTGNTVTIMVVSTPTSGWNTDYSYHKKLTITNNSSGALPVGYSVSYTFNHAALVSAGKSLANGADIRIVYWNGSSWVELDRALDLSSSWNSTATTIWFESQAAISGNSTDSNYYLYYGNPSAQPPSYDPHSLVISNNSIYDKISTVVTGDLSTNQTSFTDGSGNFWTAGPASSGYQYSFAADTWTTLAGDPNYFTATQIKNIFEKFVAARNSNGDLPVALNDDGSAYTYYSAWDGYLHHVTGDGDFFVPMMEKLYYDKTCTSGSCDISAFATTATYLKTELSHIPRDPSNTLVYVTPGDEWVPWGFHDMVRTTGDDLIGSLFYYEDSLDMAALYNTEGDTTDATFFTNEANNIKNNISTLWDSTDGMFYAATGQNHQIEVDGSAYAAYLSTLPGDLGIITQAQATDISNYLVNNYTALTAGSGYIRQSPADWAYCYAISNSGTGSGCRYSSGQYDNGLWSVANEWVANTLKITSPSQAVQFITDFSNNPNIGQEWYNYSNSGSSYSYSPAGAASNLESPLGSFGFISNNSSLFPSTDKSITTADYSNVFPFWDDFSSLKSGWSSSGGGAWNIAVSNGTGILSQTNALQNNDVKLDYDVGLSNNVLLQSDFRVDTSIHNGASVSGLCLDSGATSGYCYSGQSTSDTAFNGSILDEQVAWGSGPAFSGTNGTWYRAQIVRSGSTINVKTWAVGSPVPSSWQQTYIQSNNLLSTSIGLMSGYSTADFDNILVRDYLSGEPTLTAGSEINSDATLSNLTISQGNLSPSFSSSTISYTDNVVYNVSNLTITPTVNQANATVTVNGVATTSGSASSPISLNFGSNSIPVVVTAQDGTTTKTYTINIIRATDTTPPVTTATPAGGTYGASRNVTLSCVDDLSGCNHTYYTIDGTTPTTSSSVYSSPITISTNTTLKFFSTDLAGNPEAPKTEIYVIDATYPVTDITSSPSTTTNSTSATFAFSANKVGSTFQCKLDSGLYASCSSPKTYTSLAEGSHTFTVQATDTLGHTEPTPPIFSWSIDLTSPVRSGGSPSGTLAVNTTFITLQLNTNETATCAYSTTSGTDYASMTPFTLTNSMTHSFVVSNLQNGSSYTYYVKCQDSSGNINSDDYPISFSIAFSPLVPIGYTQSGGRIASKPISTSTTSTTVTTSSKTTSSSTTLKLGSKGNTVKTLQSFLNKTLKLNLKVDGSFGKSTLNALKQWQKKNGLTPDGVVGPKTRGKMNGKVK
jgi:hypothetical protein